MHVPLVLIIGRGSDRCVLRARGARARERHATAQYRGLGVHAQQGLDHCGRREGNWDY